MIIAIHTSHTALVKFNKPGCKSSAGVYKCLVRGNQRIYGFGIAIIIATDYQSRQ